MRDRRVTARILLMTPDTSRSTARAATTPRPRGMNDRGRGGTPPARKPCYRAIPRCPGPTVRLSYPYLSGANRVMLTLPVYTHVLNRGPAAVRSPADRMFSP